MLDKINLKKIMLKEEYKQEVPPLSKKWGSFNRSSNRLRFP